MQTESEHAHDRLARALRFALTAHEGQVRKGTGTPYVSHPMQVAGIALEYGADEDLVVAALLHDVLEDSSTTYEEIRESFGERVADVVRACSDTEDHNAKAPWQERKERYLRHLRDVGRDVALVSASDKLHNARSLLADLRQEGLSAFEKFRGGRDGTIWYYRSLLALYRDLDLPPSLLRELGVVIGQMVDLVGEQTLS